MTHVLCPEKLDIPAFNLHRKVRPGVLFLQRKPRTLSDHFGQDKPIEHPNGEGKYGVL